MMCNLVKTIILMAMLLINLGTIKAASIIVAASDSTTQAKARADYTCDGVNDEVQLLLSLTHASSYAVDVYNGPGQTVNVTCYGKHSVEWMPGTYNLGNTLTVPNSSDCVIKAEGTHINGPSSGSAVRIRGMNRCRYYFGTIKCNSTNSNDAALKISPASTMPVAMSIVSYTGLSGIPHNAKGLYIDPSSANICCNQFIGTDIANVYTGIYVGDAVGRCEQNWFWNSFIREVYQCIYERGTNVQMNVWDVNVDAWLENSEAIRTAASHGKWYVIMGTGSYIGINDALVLEPGASHNVVEMHPPITNYAWQNNSGNDTNIFLSTTIPPYIQ